MAKRKRKNIAGGIVALLCILGILLIASFGTGSSFADGLAEIWNDSIRYDQSTPAASLVTPAEDGEFLMYVIDTGNSDSIVLRTPNGQAVLVDAADNDDAQLILDTLDALDVKELAAAVATHPDADHIGSMDDVLLDIPTETFYKTSYEAQTKTYDDMIDAVEESGAPAVEVSAGYRFEVDGVSFTVLNPQGKEYGDSNNSSIVLLVEYGSTKFLLEGDAEEDAISDMLAQYPELLDVDVLKVGHHGSSNGTTEAFLEAVTPQIAVITCGKDNDYGHPHREVTDMLDEDNITTLRTDQDGDIAVFSDGSSLVYKTAA